MFENKTAEVLLKEALGRVSDKMDKREGAIIYDTLAPVCYELARAYADLDMAMDQLFPQTAAREHLLMIAAQYGFFPNAAVPLEIKVYSDTELPIGSRFNMQEYNYMAEEDLGDGMYRMVCETAGSAPNSHTGYITPIDYIEGLGELSYEGIIIPGSDEEETEAFRVRFLKSLGSTQPFGGNIADYRAKVGAMDGVGQVKVFPAYDWQGAGTVGIYIMDTEGSPASAELAARVKEALDPSPGGTGDGLAPIGHIVSVMPAEVKTADISVDIKAENSGRDIESEALAVLEDLTAEVNRDWENGRLYLYSSRITAELMKISGVVDVENVSVNESTGAECAENEIFALGDTEVNITYV